jgi:hypothetical protein
MYLVQDRKLLTPVDLSQTFATNPNAKSARVANCVALAVFCAGIVLVAEIDLLQSGALVVVMPE